MNDLQGKLSPAEIEQIPVLRPIDTTELAKSVARAHALAELHLWAVVEETFDCGEQCDGCDNKTSWTEPHGEKLRGCALLFPHRNGNPRACPGVYDQ